MSEQRTSERLEESGTLLTAAEAARALGIKPSTLYAYVSRGLLHSQAGPDARSRRYPRDEVERLRLRRDGRRDPTEVSREALSWGLPVLESAITLIGDGALYYRGLEVGALARERRFEEVAALLWLGELSRAADLFPARPVELPATWRRVLHSLRDRHPGERLQVVLRFAASEDPAAMDLRPERLAAWGARLLALLIATVGGRRHRAGEPLLGPLREAWTPDVAGGERLLHGALILCADHELNVSSFTARCVASAGSNPYEALAAALGALRGFRHGGHSDRVEEMLAELGLHRVIEGPVPAHEVRRLVEERLQRGERIPGFGQPLYPEGDPRWLVLLDLLDATFPGSAVVAAARAVAAEVESLIGQRPTVDFALATLSLELGLGPGGAFTVFALGRTAGWIGHVIEEYARGQLIRPRARYTGPMPRGGPVPPAKDFPGERL
ncbi:MAG TPA: citrate synthase family protein [Thermoanaerobaculia bacterium]|nr:citrate synthase family protein [Thermoanaerobaculia bacterium]